MPAAADRLGPRSTAPARAARGQVLCKNAVRFPQRVAFELQDVDDADELSGQAPEVVASGGDAGQAGRLSAIAGHEWAGVNSFPHCSGHVEGWFVRSHPAVVGTCRRAGIDGTVARSRPGRGFDS